MDRSSTLLISTIFKKMPMWTEILGNSFFECFLSYFNRICGYNLVVECHASDLIARVRFPLPAPLSKIVAPDENIDKSTVKG